MSESRQSNAGSEMVLSGRVRLLEADPDLGARLEGEELDQARKYAMLPAVHLEQGRWNIQQLRDARGVRGEVYGFVLTQGTITIDASFAARRAARVLAPNELILLEGWDNDTLPRPRPPDPRSRLRRSLINTPAVAASRSRRTFAKQPLAEGAMMRRPLPLCT